MNLAVPLPESLIAIAKRAGALGYTAGRPDYYADAAAREKLTRDSIEELVSGLEKHDEKGARAAVASAVRARLSELAVAGLIKLLAKKLGLSLADARKFWRGTEGEILDEMAAQAAQANDGPARDAERRRLWALCENIAESPTLMDEFVSVAHRYGIGREAHAIKTIYLSGTSRLAVKNVFNTVREGAAAGGKSFVTDSVLDFFPKESVIELTTASPMALIYMGGHDVDYLKHKVLNIAEAVVVAEKKDGSEPNPFATMLRTHLSKGFITHQVVVTRFKAPPITVTYFRNGPTVVAMTTARDNLDDELRTRLVSTKANEAQDQTIAIIKRSFSTNTAAVTTEEKEKWIALQRWLALDGPYEVVIPYIDAIGDSFDDLANDPTEPKEYPLRARRDATALKAAIGASAMLHKARRTLDGSGRIIAMLDDYRLAHDVIDPSSADAHHVVIPETALAVVEAIERLGASKTESVKVTVRALRDKLGISSTATAAARLYEALGAGLVEVVKQPSGEPYAERAPRYYKIVSSSKETKERIQTGHALRVFPTADEIAKKIKQGGVPPLNSRTGEQISKGTHNSELYQSVSWPAAPLNSNLNSAPKLNREPKTAEIDPDYLPPEEVVDDVDRVRVNVDYVDSPGGGANIVNIALENTKDSAKPPKRITDI
jgi:hypothetical protein